jgi:hypothetical protein
VARLEEAEANQRENPPPVLPQYQGDLERMAKADKKRGIGHERGIDPSSEEEAKGSPPAIAEVAAGPQPGQGCVATGGIPEFTQDEDQESLPGFDES